MKLNLRIVLPLFAIGLAATLTPSHAQTIMKCVDEKGVTHYGNPMPAQCAKTEVKELSGQGTIKKTLDRPLTKEEIKAREDEVNRTKDERRREEDMQRRDRALLATYGAEKEFDVSRDRALDAINTRQKTAEGRLRDLDDQLKKLNAELEFYKDGKGKSTKGKEAPAPLLASIERNKKDRDNTQEIMTRMEEEKKGLAAQFESDKQRWKDLKSGKAVLKAKDQVVTGVRKAGERGKLICNNVEHTCFMGQIYFCREVDSTGRLRISYPECR